jgi:sec-independent protein translocase protein TatB
MFDFSWGELLLIGAVALIVIGPKELPAVLRAVGQWTTKIRRMAGEFQSQFQEAMREAEMADLKKEVDSAMSVGSDPLGLNEVTKWEPKATPDGAVKSEGGDKPGADDVSTSDALASTAAMVTADGYSAPAPDAAAVPPAATEAQSATARPAIGEIAAAPSVSPTVSLAPGQPATPADAPAPEGGGHA